MEFSARAMDRRGQQSWLVRIACVLMVATTGLRAAFAVLFEADKLALSDYWAVQWAAGYAVFIIAFTFAQRSNLSDRWRAVLLGVQSLSTLYLIWLFPNFLVTILLVVVSWQIAWSTCLRGAIIAVAMQSIALALMKCLDQADSMSLLVLVSTCGFELFAVSAAHLARSEASARDELMKANAELRAAHVLFEESARMAERLRISRDLHDALGHNLTILAIHLDVAERLAQGPCHEHVRCARQVAGALLADVRDVVREARVSPVDLQAVLQSFTKDLPGLRVELEIPDDLTALDSARADAVLRCVQELITNALRHANARELRIQIHQLSEGPLLISARDDGRGGEVVEGQGLAGMRARFEALGGSLFVTSAPGQGLSVQGQIPALGAAS